MTIATANVALTRAPSSAWAAIQIRVTPDLNVGLASAGGAIEVVPFAVELRGGDPVISERLRA